MTRTKQITAGLITGASLLAFSAAPVSIAKVILLAGDHVPVLDGTEIHQGAFRPPRTCFDVEW